METKTKAAIAITLTVIVLVVAGVAYAFLTPSGNPARKAPGFSLKDVYGTPLNLSDHSGKVVFLEITAINCPTCNVVIKDIQKVRSKYGSDVVFLSVFVFPYETEEQIRQYREEHNATWTFAKDTDGVLDKYKAVEIPKIVILGKDGGIIFEGVGAVSYNDMKSNIDAALGGKGSSGGTVGSEFIAGLGLGGIAVMAGIASYFSPCSFPMLPGYMTFYLRDKEAAGSYRKAAAGGAVAGLGIITIYGAIGLLVMVLQSAIVPYIAYLQPIIGVALLVLGIIMLLPVQLFMSGRLIERIQKLQKGKGFLAGLFFYGMGYGAASAGCTAPVFVAVILMGFLSGSLWTGLGVLGLFCLTAALLMVGVTVLVAGLKKGVLDKLKNSTEPIKKISGVVLIIVGVYLLVFYYLAFGK